MFAKALLLISFVVSVATAILINPHITSPKKGVEWKANSYQTVQWDTKGIKGSKATGTLLLGYREGNSLNEHLDTAHPLAKDFPLKNGRIKVKVPNVDPRKRYIVVLLGNSGNASPEFTITNPTKH
ncbi:hypothetical protein BGZ80_006946 [Entomortierella chlamydospora]|uniref:Uncharacterized protein n=1 Tax=Entomortierella chlamydospora TaxID=101097 RepID=A0A9P6MG24_9FUNG|nr:hypothetical protein BGZ79_004856 [Entomortierella chlamydospora]KAF9997661.1 hypothetical protein BGZ80_006946 [Entomortierella chlamydospora]